MWIRGIIGGLLCVAGVVWIGQGAGLIHGSFMTGQISWAMYGLASLVVGLVVLSRARRAHRGAAGADG
jgi:hypothetical protein